MVVATAAAVIASQAVITGVFSMVNQAIQLRYLPRLTVRHTSDVERGQIYLPFINWALFISVLILILLFENSARSCQCLWRGSDHDHAVWHDFNFSAGLWFLALADVEGCPFCCAIFNPRFNFCGFDLAQNCSRVAGYQF